VGAPERKKAMKAIRVHELGGPEKLIYEDAPEPVPGPGEVLIRVAAAGVALTDTLIRRGESHGPGEGLKLPFIPGLEVSGTVAAVGTGVSSVREGQRVFAGTPNNGYAEMVVAPAGRVFPVPERVPLIDAAVIPVQGLTSALALQSAGQLQEGEWVLVTAAAGGVGSYAVQIAKAIGAQVVAATGSEEKGAFARKLGADASVVYRGGAWQGEVRKITGGRGVNLVLDSVGGEVFEGCLNVLSFMGRVVAIGTASGQPGRVNMERLIGLNQSINGSTLGSQLQRPQARPAIQNFMRWLAEGKVRPVIGERLPLRDAADLHRRLESRATTGNQVLLVSEQS
jgi:NADPH2:quinone reductase